MSDYTIKKFSEMEASYGGAFLKVRAELGVSSFGLAIINFPPNVDQYPEHDHSGDGQEEAYIVTGGSGEIEIDGERHPLDADTAVRVGPGATRKLYSGPEGMQVIALGGVPGKVYEIGEHTELTGEAS